MWERQGGRVAEQLDDCAAAVVLADDPSAAAHVALGIARAQARHRRVAVADLVGEIPALQARLPADAPHGLVDTIQYGVSLGKIAYPVDPAKNLFIVPSGVGPMDHDALLDNERWRALMRTFREAETLVLLVIPADLRQASELLQQTNGAIAVGDVHVANAQRVIARIAPRRPTRESSSPEPSPGDARAASRTSPFPRRATWFALAAVIALLAGAAAIWRARHTARAGPLVASIEHDSAFAHDTASAAASATARPGISIANPADSGRAAAYAVTLVTFNTAPAAEAQVTASNRQGLPAVTVSYVALGADSSRWYRVFVGAYTARAPADSLLGVLRRIGTLAPDAGRVVRAPLAVRVRDHVGVGDAHAIATDYRDKGIPVYALLQDDGTFTLYAGAFETPAQAAMLLPTLRAAGEDPVVVYRTGRVP